MASKHEKNRMKQIQDRCQRLLDEMLKDEDNKYCVDCDAKGPRWASWNIGIFLCIRCAGIHRKLGVHITKVKSVNLDSWTPTQIVCLQNMGNSRGRAVYEANLPDNFRRPQTESSLESFIRDKYEHKKYIAREWIQTPISEVNWDKDIDEEMERNKKKKRQSKQSAVATTIKSIPLPSTSAVPQALPPVIAVERKHSVTQCVDLLGLDSPVYGPNVSGGSDFKDGDFFLNFMLSGNAQEKSEFESSASITGPPSSLFDDEEKTNDNLQGTSSLNPRQLTNDSILALYGKPVAGNMINVHHQGNFASLQPTGMSGFGMNTGTMALNKATTSMAGLNIGKGVGSKSVTNGQSKPANSVFSNDFANFEW